MLSKLVKAAAAFLVVAAIAYPITREMNARAAIQREMLNTLDVNDTAALKQWQGSPEGFIAMLHERCMGAHGRDSTACTRYETPKN